MSNDVSKHAMAAANVVAKYRLCIIYFANLIKIIDILDVNCKNL
jgi:hypothetical protein